MSWLDWCEVCQVRRHEETEQELHEQISRLEARLGEMDTEYSQQLAGLRASYQRSLEQAARGVEGAQVAAGLDEGVRQRYRAEIQQLRVSTYCTSASVFRANLSLVAGSV